LFDGEPLSENFRRNKDNAPDSRGDRVTGPLSLSILFGATLSKCQFAKNSERDGLQRRFLYHVALSHARELDRPKPDRERLAKLVEQFKRLTLLKGPFTWDPAAQKRFDSYKHEVQKRQEATDPYDESTCGRLATLCTHTLKIAMIFQAACLCSDDTN